MKLAFMTLAALTLASSCFAQGKNIHHTKPAKGPDKDSWDAQAQALDDAQAAFVSARGACRDAMTDYDDVTFSENNPNDQGRTRDAAASAKHKACADALGEETKLLNACDDALKWLDKDLKAAGSDAKRKSADEARKKKITLLKDAHMMGHRYNKKKR